MQISLYLSAPSLEEIPWRADLERLAAAARHARVEFRLTRPEEGWTGPTGRLDASSIARIVKEHGSSVHPRGSDSLGPGAKYYISGPPRMVEDLGLLLAQAGVPKADIEVETFRGGEVYDSVY